VPDNTYLYVIASSPEGPCKIGFSANPEKRVRQLQTGHAYLLNLHYSQVVPNNEARKIERLVHQTIGYRRSKGEWFDISVSDAIAEVQVGLMSAIG
jgi:hypothetical protein